jgi:hypothetical protein
LIHVENDIFSRPIYGGLNFPALREWGWRSVKEEEICERWSVTSVLLFFLEVGVELSEVVGDLPDLGPI